MPPLDKSYRDEGLKLSPTSRLWNLNKFGLKRLKVPLIKVWPNLKTAAAKLLMIEGLMLGSYPVKNPLCRRFNPNDLR